MPHSRLISVRRAILLVRKIGSILRGDLISVYASQASFFIVISAIPFLVLLLSVGHALIPITAEEILDRVREWLPQPGDTLLEAVAADLSGRSRTSVLSISALTAVWSASRGTGAVLRGVRVVFGTSDSSGYILDKCRYLLHTVAFVLLLLATLLAAVFGDAIARQILSYYPALSTLIGIFLRLKGVLLFLLLSLFFALLYRTAARVKKKGERRESPVLTGYSAHLPGALFASAGWVLFSYFYSLYITYFPSVSYLYGSLAALVLMMLWLYICMNILLLGAEINKHLHTFWRLSK